MQSRKSLDMNAYADIYWAIDQNDRKSTTDYSIFLGNIQYHGLLRNNQQFEDQALKLSIEV